MSAVLSEPATADGTGPSVPDRRLVTKVADNVLELLRSLGRVKARALAAAEHDVEWSAHFLLRALQSDGPKRAGELAECVHVDPSTVSRQVAGLVRAGLLERRSDPGDGRASLLVLTDKAHEVLADHARQRLDHFAEVFRDWPEDDVEQFGTLLARFTANYDRLSTDWPPGRTRARTETNHETFDVPESED